MKRRLTAVVATAVLMLSLAAPAFAASTGDPSPGNSGHEGAGQFTAKFVPASTPGNS